MNISHVGEVIMTAEREEPIKMAIGAPTPPVKSTEISGASRLGKAQCAVQCTHWECINTLIILLLPHILNIMHGSQRRIAVFFVH